MSYMGTQDTKSQSTPGLSPITPLTELELISFFKENLRRAYAKVPFQLTVGFTITHKGKSGNFMAPYA